jgi:hypothetical protein
MTAALLTKTEPDYDLKVADRCDRCGAQAFFVALLEDCESKQELLFCAHHGRFHAPSLVEQGFDVLDFSDRLNEKPSPSSSELD